MGAVRKCPLIMCPPKQHEVLIESHPRTVATSVHLNFEKGVSCGRDSGMKLHYCVVCGLQECVQNVAGSDSTREGFLNVLFLELQPRWPWRLWFASVVY